MTEKTSSVIDEKAGDGASWVGRRAAAVNAAVARHDDDELRHLSTLPGGFGSRASRRSAWLELLHVDKLRSEPPTPDAATRFATPDTDAETVVYTPHPDEGQVSLDTRRAFVTYPRGLSPDDKAAMQEDLQALICDVLHRHPRLSYFQGFHDIVTVLYLTLLTHVPRPRHGVTAQDREEWDELVRAASVVALCRTRDAMGKGLTPMMGMLKLLRRVLAAADPALFRISSSISPVPTLPFFALSWILTLFSHDVDTLEPVQRIFDYLIARNPISAVYLAVAILMSKKRQMLKLISSLGAEARLDPSLLHPLFQRLPPLYPDTPDAPVPPPDFVLPPKKHEEENPYTPLPLSKIFQLADRLQRKYPWDGPKVRGREVMGPGSVVLTFDRERGGAAQGNEGSVEDEKAALAPEWTLADAEAAIDNDVVLPGGDELEEDDDLAPSRWPSSLFSPEKLGRILGARRDRIGALVALGVVALGIGAALCMGGSDGRYHHTATWSRWWAGVLGQWAAKRDLLLQHSPFGGLL